MKGRRIVVERPSPKTSGGPKAAISKPASRSRVPDEAEQVPEPASGWRGIDLTHVPAYGPEGPREHPMAYVRRHARGGQPAPQAKLQAKPQVGAVSAAPGERLPSPTLQDMNARFGEDFGGVRIHRDAQGAKAANEIHARAFTVGQDIVFGVGEYAPGTLEGDALLAHELAHTVQQRGARMQGTLSVSHPMDAQERQADVVAHAVMSGKPAPALGQGPMQIARLEKGAATPNSARTEEQIAESLREQLGVDPYDLALRAGFGPISMTRLEQLLIDAGFIEDERPVLSSSGRPFDPDPRPQLVLDEVLEPHPYQEGRFVPVAKIGTAEEITEAKASGQHENDKQAVEGALFAFGAMGQARLRKRQPSEQRLRGAKRPPPPRRLPEVPRVSSPRPAAGRPPEVSTTPSSQGLPVVPKVPSPRPAAGRPPEVSAPGATQDLSKSRSPSQEPPSQGLSTTAGDPARLTATGNIELMGQVFDELRRTPPTQRVERFESMLPEVDRRGGGFTATGQTGSDGSRIYLGTTGQALVITPSGDVYRGIYGEAVVPYGETGNILTPLYNKLKKIL